MTETIFWLVLAGIVAFVAIIGVWAALECRRHERDYQDWILKRNEYIDFMEGKNK